METASASGQPLSEATADSVMVQSLNKPNIDIAKQQFTQKVTRLHKQFCGLGLRPNDAAAVALKVAAGTAEAPLQLSEVVSSVEQATQSGQGEEKAGPLLRRLFSSAETYVLSCLLPSADKTLLEDKVAVKRLFRALEKLESWKLDDELNVLCGTLLGRPMHALSHALSAKLLSLLCRTHLLGNTEVQHRLAADIGLAAAKMGKLAERLLVQEFVAHWDADELEDLVCDKVQLFLTLEMYYWLEGEGEEVPDSIAHAAHLLSLLYKANEAQPKICHKLFYNDVLNQDVMDLDEDVRRWQRGDEEFSFCSVPCMYDPASKSRILQRESQSSQAMEYQEAFFSSMLGSGTCPFLVLKVRRGPTLVNDTLIQIQRASANGGLKRPLKVHFIGEEGVDEGGVQKEFFQLLMRQLFDPDFGMFLYDEATRLHWFRPSDLDLKMEYELVGIMVGLAIYNAHIVEFAFPQVTYRMLMGNAPEFEDLRQIHPDIHSSLKRLLEYDGGEEGMAAMSLYFQVEQPGDFGGVNKIVDLKPNGGDLPVTLSNRRQYVQLYAHHLLATSIKPQFGAFYAGFHKLCDGPAIAMFRPDELEDLICGSEEMDFKALEGTTRYEGFAKDAPVIKWFWEVVHAFETDKKKRLLFFVTGSDRVPIRGLATLQFVIAQNGPHSDRLPTAHTCFNHLLLPAYKDKESLCGRLLTAIENAEGFGLM